MTNSRNRQPALPLGLALLAALSISAASAVAQTTVPASSTGAPVQLLPGAAAPATPPSNSGAGNLPTTPSPAPSSSGVVPTDSRAPAGIEVEEVGKPTRTYVYDQTTEIPDGSANLPSDIDRTYQRLIAKSRRQLVETLDKDFLPAYVAQ